MERSLLMNNALYRSCLLIACGILVLLVTGCATEPKAVGLPPDIEGTGERDVVMLDNKGAAHSVYDEGLDLDLVHADIWGRVRAGYAMPDLQNELVKEKEQWYLSRPNYFKNTGERANLYLYYILEEIEKRNMPAELALLPFVESAFNPHAVSAAQAAGMWQFIPSTGHNFSLKQDMFRDERRDIIASTNAALDYLQKLYDMFGDWHLALAAYNCGEGTIQKAVERNRKKGEPTDYSSLKLPRETQNYVPTLQALKNIIGNPAGYQANLPIIANHPFFQTIALERDMDTKLVAQFAGITPEEFRALNPAINKPVILVEITPQILLPWSNAETFLQTLSQYQGPLVSWTVWKAPSNMYLTQVANATQMSERELRQVNDIPAGVQVKKGSVLLIRRKQTDNIANVELALLKNATLEFVKTHSIKRRPTRSKIAVSTQARQLAAGLITPMENDVQQARTPAPTPSKNTATNKQRRSSPSKIIANAQKHAATSYKINSNH